MQSKKILVACLSLLIVGLALPSIPRANAFFTGNINVTLGGIIRGFTDPNGNTADVAQAGSTLTITVAIQASNSLPAYQRNVTVGFKGDWMSQYTNSSTASQSSTLALTNNQVGSASISITLPSTGGLSPTHTWTIAVWDGPANTLNGADCTAGRTERTKSCETVQPGQPGATGYGRLAFYTGDQFGAAQADLQADTQIASVNTAITQLEFHPTTPGVTAAAGQLAQARSEQTMGDQSWSSADYAGAKTHFQNAVNDANAAAGSLTNQGGGVDNATLLNLVLGGTGIALIGVGALFAGIGGFFYLRRKPKA
jgi:hypothetical protein